MVLFAVLCHPALDPEQAARRLRAVRIDCHSCLHAVARYLAGPLGALSPALPDLLLAIRDRGGRPWLARLQAAGRHLCDPVAALHVLLFRLLPHRSAAARHFREDQAVAQFDFGIGAGRIRAAGSMTMKRAVFALTLAGILATPALAQEHQVPPPAQKWSFAGPFGKYDEAQLQRGF